MASRQVLTEWWRWWREGERREHGGESWIMWKINTFEALELAGRRGVVSAVKCPAFVFIPSTSLSLALIPSLTLHVNVCAASASGCWCRGSSALGLCLTHMQLGINAHTCRDLATHPQAALGAEFWQDLCSLTSIPAVSCVPATLGTLLGGYRLFLIGGCCDFCFSES